MILALSRTFVRAPEPGTAASPLEEAQGFVGLELLVEGEDFVVLTRWSSSDAFEAWAREARPRLRATLP